MSARAWWVRFAALFDGERRRATKDGELAAELEAHLAMHIEDNVRRGMTPESARRDALMQLGGLDQAKEKVRERRGIPFIESLLQDVRFGLRMLRKSPGFTATAIVILALGIGGATAIFTVAYATLLAPLPYPQPDRLVNVWSKLQGHRNSVSVGDFIDWKQQNTAFEELDAWGEGDFNIAGQDRREDIVGIQATPGYYGMFGNPLLFGRNFLSGEGESGKEQVVILTYRLWRHLGANPKIIGRAMQMNGEPYTVVGVLRAGPADRSGWELMVPLVFKPEQRGDRESRYWLVTGRLKPGVTIRQAQAEMDSITANQAKDYPKSNQGVGALVEPFRNDFLPRDRQLTLWLLLGAVGFLLLIAYLNVANLLLAKGIPRQREVAIRGSLGAKPAAIFAQFLAESLVLAIMSTIAGVAMGYAMLLGLIAAIPPNVLPGEADLRLNVPVLLIVLGATTLASALFGCVSAWYASSVDPAGALKEGGHSGVGVHHQRIRRILVITEFALALPLLAGAGLVVHSFRNLMRVDLGVRTDHILGFYVIPAPVPQGPQQINSYYRRILASIEAVPGVSHACAMSYLPLDSMHAEMPFTLAGQPEYASSSLRPNADFETVTPDYFQTFGIRIVKGRAFTDADDASSQRVAVVNETFVRRFLPGADPLGQRVVMEQVGGEPKNGPAVEWRIVGVFHTVKSRGSREDNPEIDTPFWQEAFPLSGISVRTTEDPGAMAKTIAAAVNSVDSQAALALVRTMEQVHDEDLANDRFTVILFVSFAVVALLLATVGIYGVISYLANQRTHEIGIRIALGAPTSHVVKIVVGEGINLALVGVLVGVGGALALTRFLRSILFGVAPADPVTFAGVIILLLGVAMLACYIPARRATKVDPMVALRYE